MKQQWYFQTQKSKDLLIFSAVAFLIWIVFYVLDFNGLYGQDSHAYLAYSKELSKSIATGVEAPNFFWPKLFPFLGAILSFLGLSHLHALQLISFVAIIAAVTISYRLCLRLFGTTSILYFIIGGFTQIYFVRSGYLGMSDMLAAALCMLVFSFFFAYKKDQQTPYLLGLILAALAAVFVRYAVVPLIALPLFITVIYWVKKMNRSLQALIVTGVLVITGIVVFYNNHFIQESIYRLGDWSFRNAFSRTIIAKDGINQYTVPNCLYVFGNFFHLGYFSFGIALLPFYKHLTRESKWLLVFSGIYLFFLLGLNMQNYRFLLLTHLPIWIALFPAFKSFINWSKKGAFLIVLSWGMLNVAFAIFSFSKTFKAHRLEREIVSEVKTHLKNEAIYSFFVDQSFPSYGINNRVYNFFMEDYTQFEKGALVVFNEQQFQEQWKGHRVMKNWNRLCATNDLDTLEVLTDNWIIYRIR
jgi:4-amino-4-deoxy-L-arabinose transferase-like glycosyltransferase